VPTIIEIPGNAPEAVSATLQWEEEGVRLALLRTERPKAMGNETLVVTRRLDLQPENVAYTMLQEFGANGPAEGDTDPHELLFERLLSRLYEVTRDPSPSEPGVIARWQLRPLATSS
jgi:hypothetical protein